MELGAHVALRVAEPDFLKKIFLPQKWGFLNLLENSVTNFFQTLVYTESLY